ITVLFAIAGEIVLRNVTKSMSDSLEAEVQGSFHAYASLWETRSELLNSVSRLLASMSDVRAAFGTRDQATIRDSASELWSRISTSTGLFLVTDPRGMVIASLGGVTAPSLRKDLDLVQSAAERFPQQSSGFYLDAGELYHLSVTPVYVEPGGGQDLLNVLVAGRTGGRACRAALEGGHQQRVSVPGALGGDRFHLEPARHGGRGGGPGQEERQPEGERWRGGIRAFRDAADRHHGPPRRQDLHSAFLRGCAAADREPLYEYHSAVAGRHDGGVCAHLPAGAAHCGTGGAVGSGGGGGGAAELRDRSTGARGGRVG